ncbi:MAG: hypothetical protein GSR80_000839 [Desulfurococcales archaeon]|nr:hypothetical protein [Desulfurococcales archaeon]
MKWVYHRKFTELICGEYHQDIDKVIDSGRVRRKRRKTIDEMAERFLRGIMQGAAANVEIPPEGAHDDVKMNLCALMKRAEEFYGKYGESGLCQLVLHILLDKANSAVRGAVTASLSSGSLSPGFEDVCARALDYLKMNVSTLTLVEYWDDIVRSSEPAGIPASRLLKRMQSRVHHIPSKESLRSKKNNLEAIILNARKSGCLDKYRDSRIVSLLANAKNHVDFELERLWGEVCCAALKHYRDPSMAEKLGCSGERR